MGHWSSFTASGKPHGRQTRTQEVGTRTIESAEAQDLQRRETLEQIREIVKRRTPRARQSDTCGGSSPPSPPLTAKMTIIVKISGPNERSDHARADPQTLPARGTSLKYAPQKEISVALLRHKPPPERDGR